MARMPTRDKLPQRVPEAARGIVPAPSNNIGEAITGFGQVVARHAKEDKEKNSSMELARARSFWQTSLLEGKNSYNLRDKPDYKAWGEEFEKGSGEWQKTAASHITDPQLREKFLLETADDRVRYNINVANEARKIGNADQLTSTQQAIEQMAVNAARSDLSDDERQNAQQDIGETFKGLVRSGIYTPQQAAAEAIKLKKRISKLRVMEDIKRDPVAAKSALSGGGGSTVSLIKQFEGYRSTPYWDVNAQRVGYGSDTITTAEGKVLKVKKGMKVTRADAERDLERRIVEFQNTIKGQVGAARFKGLPGNVQSALTSVAYNYGSLPKSVAAAVKTGDIEKIALAIEARAVDNNGINEQRRHEEAAVVRGVSDSIKSQSYYRDLNAEDRMTLGAQADVAAEKVMDEQDKEDRIDETRTLVDHAVSQIADRKEAADYVKENASDPSAREDALAALDAEFRRQDAAERQARIEQYDTTFTAVQQHIEAGDLEAAHRAIPADMPGEERRKLKQLINKGPATVDNSEVYRDLQAMRMSDPTAFAEVDLRKFQTDLTAATIDSLHAAQEKMKGDDVKHTTLQNADAMLKDEMRAMGIVLGAKATESDIRYAQRIRAMAAPEIERREAAKGKPLTTRELQEVIDDTFVSFRGTRAGYLWSSEETITAVDVMKDYTDVEADEDMIAGDLMDMALRQFKQVNPNMTPTPEMLYDWLQKYKNRKQTNG